MIDLQERRDADSQWCEFLMMVSFIKQHNIYVGTIVSGALLSSDEKQLQGDWRIDAIDGYPVCRVRLSQLTA